MPSSIMPFFREQTIVGGTATGSTTVYSDAFDTSDFKEVLLQLKVVNMIGGNLATFDVSWEISNDGKNWLAFPAAGMPFTTVTIAIPPGGPTTWHEMVKETNIGAYMRVKVVLADAGGNDMGVTFAVIGTAR